MQINNETINNNTVNITSKKCYNNIVMQFPHLQYKKLQEKKCRQLIHIIRNSRLADKMRFSTYATLDVGADGMTAAITETQPEFKRAGTMCMVYDIIEPLKYGYDKLFLLMHVAGESSYFDYIVYNTKTRKSVCHFYKNPDISAAQDVGQPSSTLLTDLNISFNRMESTAVYK